MYEWLPEVCKEIRSNMIEIYWISIVPLTLLLIILEFFKLPEREPNALGIIKRAALSIILLMSFDEVFRMISLMVTALSLISAPRLISMRCLARCGSLSKIWSLVGINLKKPLFGFKPPFFYFCLLGGFYC